MCGIAGFLNLQRGPTTPTETLATMLRSIIHRGPDDEGTWHSPDHGLGIGMRRLSIIDLSGGAQPIWNEGGTVGIVFNGEIYNHNSLRAQLEGQGHRFKTRSDTEVIVHLYEQHGIESALGQLRGMYAFAIVDREKGQVVFARDPFGQKPLYLRTHEGALAFGSEIKAVALPDWPPLRPDETRFLDYAYWMSLPAPHTHFHGVTKLAPGEWQVRSFNGSLLAGGIKPRIQFSSPRTDRTQRELETALDETLDESLELHLKADVPVGLLLSGGLDSRTIGVYAARRCAGRLHSFTATFDGGQDERKPARETAIAIGSEHTEVPLDSHHLISWADRLVEHLDEPIGDPAAFAVFQLCRAAAERGIKVLLSGEGSDELFAGYTTRYLVAQRQRIQTDRLRRWLRWAPPSAAAFPEARLPRYIERAHLDPQAELVSTQRVGLPASRLYFSEDQLRTIRTRSLDYAQQLDFRHPDALSTAQQLDLRWNLPECLLTKADRMSMAASVELRCPFLDTGVAALAGGLTVSSRLDRIHGIGKVILRQTVERRSPGSANRPKEGFPMPLGQWLRGPLKNACRPAFLDSGSFLVGFFGAERAAGIWAAFENRQLSPHVIYSLWLYSHWYHKQILP